MSIRQRALIGTIATLGVVGATVGLYVAQAPEHAATEIQVEDTAGVLYEPDLLEGIEAVRFYEPTTVAVFTHRGGQEALMNDRALNDAVLAHARETRTDWLSENEQKWADDLFIFAVDPEGRLVGTYFGENRAVNEGSQLAIQEATKDDLRAGRWTEGSVTGVQAAAERMNAPAARSAGGVVTGVLASLATIGGAGGWLLVGTRRAGKSRSARAEGDTAMANVVRDYEVTEVHARLIPEDSRYGGLMLRRYDEYTKGFAELTELGNQARAIPERAYTSKDSLERLTAYRDKATALDHLDDVIADTAALLNRDRAWPEAWGRQVDPVRADLEGVETLLAEDLNEELRGLPEAQELREFSSQALAELDQLRGGLEHQQVTPDDALHHLRRTRDQLSGHLDALAGAVAVASYDVASERDMMNDALRKERLQRVHEPTIISTADPTWTWFAVSSFRTGYSSGTSAVQQSQASSSGSTSGYSSSGGSFSGSGSSSRF